VKTREIERDYHFSGRYLWEVAERVLLFDLLRSSPDKREVKLQAHLQTCFFSEEHFRFIICILIKLIALT